MSLKDGLKKMSKSEVSDLSRINLKDSKDLIINKIKKAKTDPYPIPNNIKELENRPEAENLLGIYSSLKNQTIDMTLVECGGKNFSEFKTILSEVLIDKISPIANQTNKLLNNVDYLDKILISGAEKASEIAENKVKEIKKIVGF
tara:strand:- start:1501 stop:1935 length:435 start_codon:yes stop_codon:yes gene_type:complete